MIPTAVFPELTRWLAGSRRPLLLTHRRPDGDALGSVAALSALLRRRGAAPVAALYEPFPPRYSMLQPLAEWRDWAALSAQTSEFDAAIVLDTCAYSQLEPVSEFLRSAPRTLVIDHHRTRDAIGTRTGDLRVIDEEASANALILAEWIAAERIPLEIEVATALFVGIATDCGWFRFSNTDARTLSAAATLAAAGVKLDELYNALYQQEPVAKLRLIGRLLNSLEMHAGGQLAVMALRPEDFQRAGADRSMTEDLVNEAGRAANVECTLLFTDEGDGEIRVNLRSRRRIDVAEIARQHGGGGHARAAGCRLRGDWESLVPAFVQSVAALLRN